MATSSKSWKVLRICLQIAWPLMVGTIWHDGVLDEIVDSATVELCFRGADECWKIHFPFRGGPRS